MGFYNRHEGKIILFLLLLLGVMCFSPFLFRVPEKEIFKLKVLEGARDKDAY